MCHPLSVIIPFTELIPGDSTVLYSHYAGECVPEYALGEKYPILFVSAIITPNGSLFSMLHLLRSPIEVTSRIIYRYLNLSSVIYKD